MSEENELYPGTWAQRTPDKPAIVMAESGQVVTYAELDDAARRLRARPGSGFRLFDVMVSCVESSGAFALTPRVRCWSLP